MQLHKMKARKCDARGCGHFGASRGDRQHNGVDLACMAGTLAGSPTDGMVSKIGYPYADDLSFRYVEIESQGYAFRVFYVDPLVSEGQQVKRGDILGSCQSLMQRYPGITDHLHFEIKDERGDYVDPTPVLIAQGWQK
jgi:murein DD-endopeptidase MepM/ murein hydrolase activator NlpD